MFFNKSHINLIKIKNIFVKKINKYKFLIKGDYKNIKNSSKSIVKIRKLNLYTSRGLRTSKQIVFKRKGKKNNYI